MKILSILSGPARRLGRFFRREDGNPTVEFVLAFPVVFVIFLSTMEAGMLMLRHFFLERGLDVAVRTVRLSTAAVYDADDIRNLICSNSRIMNDCEDAVRIEMEVIDPRVEFDPDPVTECVDVSDPAQPAENFATGDEHDLMLLRACALYDVWMPLTGLGLQLTKINGQYALVSLGAFVMEPE